MMAPVLVSVPGRETDVTLGPGSYWKGTHCAALLCRAAHMITSLYAIHSWGGGSTTTYYTPPTLHSQMVQVYVYTSSSYY